ncbi:unnamed protein product [Brassica rapa subsp. trilocularis]
MRISWMMPRISFLWRLLLIALTSVRLSVKALILWKPKARAFLSADRIATASAISGELTECWIAEPWSRSGSPCPSKVQAKPARWVSFSQAASVVHLMVSLLSRPTSFC